MMTLPEFKTQNGITTLKFYKSKTTRRFVAGFGKDNALITSEDFNPKKQAFVYDNPSDKEGKTYILSNTTPKAAEFTL